MNVLSHTRRRISRGNRKMDRGASPSRAHRPLLRLAMESVGCFAAGLGSGLWVVLAVVRYESVGIAWASLPLIAAGLWLGFRSLRRPWTIAERRRVGLTPAVAGTVYSAMALLIVSLSTVARLLEPRGTVARTKDTQAILGEALLAYADDHGAFPTPPAGTQVRFPLASLRVSRKASEILEKLPPDVMRGDFAMDAFDGYMTYASDGESAIIVSPGPDLSLSRANDNIVYRVHISRGSMAGRFALLAILGGAGTACLVMAVILRIRRKRVGG